MSRVEELEAALERLAESGDLEEIASRVAQSPPELQGLLQRMMQEVEWFNGVEEEQLLKVATQTDIDSRIESIRNLIKEEIQIGMLIGVTLGYGLANDDH